MMSPNRRAPKYFILDRHSVGGKKELSIPVPVCQLNLSFHIFLSVLLESEIERLSIDRLKQERKHS